MVGDKNWKRINGEWISIETGEIYDKEGYDRYDNSQCPPKKERHIRKQLAEKSTYLARFAHYGICINL